MRNETKKSIVGYAVLAGMGLCFLALRYYWDSDEGRLAVLTLLAAVPIAGLVVLWKLGERLTIEAIAIPERAMPADGGIGWLEVQPEFKRKLRKDTVGLAVGIWIMLMALVLWVGYTGVFSPLDATRTMLVIGLFALMGVLPAITVFRTPKDSRMRLGTDGSRFFLDPGDGKVEEYPFDALATERGLKLLAGRRLIVLRYKQSFRFAEEDLLGLILARVPRSGRLGSFRFFLRTLRQGNRPAWLALIAVVIWSAYFLVTHLPAN
jgi:hypothetical protein